MYTITHESTDDAYVTSYIHPISSRIAGTVTQVNVDDNQKVKQGQTLVELDPKDYQVVVQQAQAALENAKRATCIFLIEREPMHLNELKQGDWAGILTMAIGLGCLQTVLEEGIHTQPYIIKAVLPSASLMITQALLTKA